MLFSPLFYHVRGGHGGVVCTQAGLNLFGHLGCGMMRALIDVCGPARKPSEPSEDSGNPCRRIFYNVETSSTQAGNRSAPLYVGQVGDPSERLSAPVHQTSVRPPCAWWTHTGLVNWGTEAFTWVAVLFLHTAEPGRDGCRKRNGKNV